jgi:DNA-directed RNA polymerase specialized sigma24 family protein
VEVSARWELTPASFDRLLLALHPDRDCAAEEYEKLRFKITKLLEWRGCPSPEEFADRVLDRLARRIEAGEQVEQIYSYCCGIACMLLLLEGSRQAEKDRDFERQLSAKTPDPPEIAIPMEIFERCLAQLPEESRELVLLYYHNDKQAKIDRRRELADRLGMPLNALRLRVHRIRARLQKCVERHGLKIPDTPMREE